jgi:hypothetical protein
VSVGHVHIKKKHGQDVRTNSQAATTIIRGHAIVTLPIAAAITPRLSVVSVGADPFRVVSAGISVPPFLERTLPGWVAFLHFLNVA